MDGQILVGFFYLHLFGHHELDRLGLHRDPVPTFQVHTVFLHFQDLFGH